MTQTFREMARVSVLQRVGSPEMHPLYQKCVSKVTLYCAVDHCSRGHHLTRRMRARYEGNHWVANSSQLFQILATQTSRVALISVCLLGHERLAAGSMI